jgi:protein-disulfide isomerase
LKNKVWPILISTIAIITLFILGDYFYKNNKTKELELMAKNNNIKFSPDYSPKMGQTNAKVQLVEFFDPECESCREFYPSVKMLLNEFEGKIQLTVRYAPFHANSVFAIKILEASRKQGKFWETLDLLFQYQPQWGSHHNPRPDLIWKYLPEIGLDIDKIKLVMNDPEIETIISKEVADLQTLGIKMTPTFFVNGKILTSLGYEPLKKLIQDEINLADGEKSSAME